MGDVPATAWEGRTLDAWRAAWDVPAVYAFARTGSTNDIARTLADQGAPHGAVVLAEEQTAGRGRRGRHWHAAPGQALLLSVVLRPPTARAPGAAPLRAGLAVARALERTGGVHTRLKWPNDVLVDDRKIAGILCEGATTGGQFTVIVGIGVNVHQHAADFPPDVAGQATSLRLAGSSTGRAAVAATLLRDLLAPGGGIADPLDAAELAAYHRRDALRERRVTVDGRDAGTACGITPDGALRVRTDDGEHLLHTGTVRVRPRETTVQETTE